MIHDDSELIFKHYNINTYVETGIYQCSSLIIVNNMFKKNNKNYIMYGVDYDKMYCDDAKEKFKDEKNVNIVYNDSTKFLEEFVISEQAKNKTLFYLDAHWHIPWPLKSEITTILKLNNKPIIIIDDCKVPGKAFGYDSYFNEDCSIEYFGDMFKNRAEYVYYFNTGNIANRGFGIIFVDENHNNIEHKNFNLIKQNIITKEIL